MDSDTASRLGGRKVSGIFILLSVFIRHFRIHSVADSRHLWESTDLGRKGTGRGFYDFQKRFALNFHHIKLIIVRKHTGNISYGDISFFNRLAQAAAIKQTAVHADA